MSLLCLEEKDRCNFIMNNLLKNKIDRLWNDKCSYRNETWHDLVIMLDSIVSKLKLDFSQEILLTKIIDKLHRTRSISKDYCKDIIYLLNNNGLNLFGSLSKGEKISDNTK